MSEIILEEANEEEVVSEVAAESQETERPIVFEEALEAILFAAGHPMNYATLARVFELTPSKIKEKVSKYAEIYNNSDVPRGVILLTYADSCQLCTKKYYLTEIREALGIKKSGSLSSSSMEALAIVAYNQPVTKAFIEQIRGVDCSAVLSNLCQKSLVEEVGRLELPGRPLIYGTTSEFLRCFNVSSLSELPELPRENNEAEEEKDEENEKNSDNEGTDFQLEVDEKQNLM